MTSADLSERRALWWENIINDWFLNRVICAFARYKLDKECAGVVRKRVHIKSWGL